MRLFWKILASVACLIVVGGVAVFWSIHEKRADERKLIEAAQATRILADQGNARAERDLGSLYFYGRGVTQDLSEAARWYQKSAEQGDADGENGLAYAYIKGQGVTQNYAEALRLFRMSAEQGDAKAQNNLGLMYSQGQGVPQDYTEALRWYSKATEQHYAPAEYNLGDMYYIGHGVRVDRGEARRWFHKAADHGDDYAKRALSLRLTTLNAIPLLIMATAGLVLATKPFSLNVFEPGESIREFRQKASVAAGIVLLFTTGMNWYGYTHYLMRSLAGGLNTFTVIIWLLKGISLALLVYVVLSARKTELDESTLTPA
jgi:hypothetical protein